MLTGKNLTDEIEEAKGALRQCKLQVMDMFARNEKEREEWQRCWPFDD